uniref:DUF1758 domain-containing protein n=1 Tax=Strongyloides papillosus TaxID=174720 RepID=A0A0N5C9G1_STREA
MSTSSVISENSLPQINEPKLTDNGITGAKNVSLDDLKASKDLCTCLDILTNLSKAELLLLSDKLPTSITKSLLIRFLVEEIFGATYTSHFIANDHTLLNNSDDIILKQEQINITLLSEPIKVELSQNSDLAKHKMSSTDFIREVKKFDHEGERPFDTFLTEINLAFELDMVVNDEKKQKYLLSRLDPKTLEIVGHTLKDNYDDFVEDLKTKIPQDMSKEKAEFMFTNFHLDRKDIIKSLQQFATITQKVMSSVASFQRTDTIRRKLMDLFVFDKDLWGYIRDNYNQTTQLNTFIHKLALRYQENGIFRKKTYNHTSTFNGPTCDWCQFQEHQESECLRKSKGLPKKNYAAEKAAFKLANKSSPIQIKKEDGSLN